MSTTRTAPTTTRPSSAHGKSDTFKVVPLNTASDLLEAPRGRPRKLKMPPLPKELLDGMTPLEQEHFAFFIKAIESDYGITKPSDYVALYMAGLEYISLLRVQAKQLVTQEIITAARQHPGVQLRAWLDSMAATRAKRKDSGQSEDDREWRTALQKLSG